MKCKLLKSQYPLSLEYVYKLFMVKYYIWNAMNKSTLKNIISKWKHIQEANLSFNMCKMLKLK